MSKPWKPHRYQTRAMRFVIERGCAGLFLDPGLGKTSITYGAFKVLKQRDLAERMLVIAPLRPAESTWPKEREKWDDFKGLRVHVLHGPHKDKLLRAPHDVSVINPEGLAWLLGYMKEETVIDPKTGRPKVNPKTGGPVMREVRVPGAVDDLDWFWDMLAVDESTGFKYTTTERFGILKPHLRSFERRVILTGSPAPNSLMDLYGQVFILDLGASLGTFITRFRRRYFDQTGFGGYTWEPKEGAEEEIYKVLRKLVLRMSAEDYLDMPPLIGAFPGTAENPPLIHEVELPPKARQAYTQMETLLMAQLDDGTVTAANVGAATMKCRQMANGGLYKDGGGVSELHEAKLEMLLELLDELGGKPALVAYEFQHDRDRILRALAKRKEFKDKVAWLGGGVEGKAARAIEDRWNSGKLKVLLAQPASVAHGINIQEVGAAVIFYSLIWNLEHYEQLIRRVWRQGQKERVVVHHIAAKGTVDRAVLRGLAKKDRTQRALLAALREVAAEDRRERRGARVNRF